MTEALATTPLAGAAARADVQALARQVQALPPLPDALQAVLEAMQQEHGTLRRSITLIERDQALTATVLRLANSAFYGVPGQVHRIDDAIRLLGLRNVAAVLSASALRQSLCTDACTPFSFRAYWGHALLSAMAARALALRSGAEPDAAFLGGLMHTLGLLVLAALLPEPTGQALVLARQRHIADEEAEHAVLGFSHRPLGALLLARWRFPDDVVQAVAAADVAQPTPGDAASLLACVVQTGGHMAHLLQFDPAALERPEHQAELAERARALGLGSDALTPLVGDLRDAAESLAIA